MRLAVLALTVAVALAACGRGGGDPVAKGDALFHGNGTCATCHGPNLEGTVMGPSLLDPRYDAAVLGDEQIRAAVRNGVRFKNWQAGVMPALPHLDDDDIDAIIAFVRSEQRSEGNAP